MGRRIIKIEQPNKKDDVLKAAIEIFSKKGYPSATIREIAAKAGVSIGTIYFYFKNKAEILKEIFIRMDDMPITSFAANKTTEKDAFREICKRSFEFISRDIKLIGLFLTESTKSAKLSDFFYEGFYKTVNDLAGLFEKYSKNGVFRSRNHEETAICVMTSMLSIAMFKEGPFKRQLKDMKYEDCVRYFSDIFLNGLLTEKNKDK
ncbi:MAG: TetR/AcrR family transcriptional regulator [Candidatus Wallbacteria bacterium]